MVEYVISLDEEKRLLAKLAQRGDTEAERLRRFLNLPDLSRAPDSPLHAIVEQVKNLPLFKNFDLITIPEIVSAKISFDLFNFAPDHPARSHSDTYYLDEENILRTHDTVMWYYYLNHPEIKKKIVAQESLGVLCYGKVYRKDEIDRRHLNVFHQMGGLYLVPDSHPTLTIDDLKKVLIDITQNLFGSKINLRFNPDTFPYTDPSLEVEVNPPAGGNKQWIEILGGGLPRKEVLANFGVHGYHGWAFGFGLERLAILSLDLPDIRLLWSADPRVKKQLKLGHQYQAVSKYPPITRDISFIVPNSFIPNNYFDLIRDLGGDLVEEVTLLDKYENATKFGAEKISYTYRIIYRHLDRTLTNEEINSLDEKIRARTASDFLAVLR
jgi:phenylalanyl-tRNA synthetase alpha chain